MPRCDPLEGRALLAPAVAMAPAVVPEAQIDAVAQESAMLRARPPRFAFGPAFNPRPSVLRNLVYRTEGDRPERLDLYLPAGAPPIGGWPVVLAIHGGGWRQFSKEMYGPKVAPLVRAGFAVAAVDYTLSSPGRPSWPENFEDLRDAVRWLRANAAALSLDPGRIAAMGESSGGHLASLLGTVSDGPLASGGPSSGTSSTAMSRVEAVVDFYGPADLAALVVDSGGGPAAVQMLGDPPFQIPVAYRDASPVSHVSPDDPPFLIFHGEADPVVALRQSQVLAATLTSAGVPNRLVVFPRAGHGFGLSAGRGVVFRDVVGFLRAAL